MSAWTCRSIDGKAARKIVPPVLESHDGADSEEKHEPASDIDTVVVDSLKALDPKRPIREAVIMHRIWVDGTEMRRSEEHTSELQSRQYLVCRLLLEKKKKQSKRINGLQR